MSVGRAGLAPRVALVVGSGSVRCAAAIGLWRVLQRAGVEVDLVVGCSGGALFSAALALGHSPEEVEAVATRLFRRRATSQRDPMALWRAAFPRLFGFTERWGLRDERPLLAGLHGAFGDRTFADATRRLLCTATDLHTGEQVVLSEGRIVDAVRASIAIPFAFPRGPSTGACSWTASSPTRCRWAWRCARARRSSSRWASRAPSRRAYARRGGSPSRSAASRPTTCCGPASPSTARCTTAR